MAGWIDIAAHTWNELRRAAGDVGEAAARSLYRVPLRKGHGSIDYELPGGVGLETKASCPRREFRFRPQQIERLMADDCRVLLVLYDLRSALVCGDSPFGAVARSVMAMADVPGAWIGRHGSERLPSCRTIDAAMADGTIHTIAHLQVRLHRSNGVLVGWLRYVPFAVVGDPHPLMCYSGEGAPF